MNCTKLLLATCMLTAACAASAKDYTARINTAYVTGSGASERLVVTLDKATTIASSGSTVCNGPDHVFIVDSSENKPLLRATLLAAAASGAMVRITGDGQCRLYLVALYNEGIGSVTIIHPKY